MIVEYGCAIFTWQAFFIHTESEISNEKCDSSSRCSGKQNRLSVHSLAVLMYCLLVAHLPVMLQ